MEEGTAKLLQKFNSKSFNFCPLLRLILLSMRGLTIVTGASRGLGFHIASLQLEAPIPQDLILCGSTQQSASKACSALEDKARRRGVQLVALGHDAADLEVLPSVLGQLCKSSSQARLLSITCVHSVVLAAF